MEDEGREKGPLFGEVTVSILAHDDLTLPHSEGLIELVQHNGGRCIPWWKIEQGSNDIGELTHIVSTSIDYPRYTEALEKGVYTVKPGWIISSANKGKLSGTLPYNPDPALFFQEVVVTTAGLPEGDKDAIIAGVIAMGGMYSSNLSRLCTHLVVNDTENQKARVVLDKQLDIKIVLPHWVDDCLRLGRKINERPYCFPDPEYLRKHGAKVRDVQSPQIDGATAATPTELRSDSSPSDERRNLNVLMSKRVMLSDDLELGEGRKRTLVELIEYSGATLTTNVDEAHIYVGHYRDGEDYVQASRAKKTVGNLSWLYNVLNRNKWSSPTSRLLHYPVPREPIQGFEKLKISISNYNGEARTYLDNLIQHCGAEFTKTMKQTNTHLITAHTQSEKCDAAQEWNINLVNHIWLEESYAKCEAQSLTNPRYTYFPARTNLGEVVGQTRFDMDRLEQVYFPEPKKTPLRPVQHKAKPQPAKTSNVQSPAISIDEGEPTPDASTTKKPRGRPLKSAATPRAQAIVDDEKENESPTRHSSGRASKAKAVLKIHDAADDISQFQKEMKRKGGVTHGGRRSSHAEDFSSPAPALEDKGRRKKRPSDEGTYDVTAEGSDLSDGETQGQKPAKKAKTKSTTPAAELPPVRYKMMVTGDERWIDKANRESQDRSTLLQMGVRLTQKPEEVDILVAPKILRTRKFVCALASAPLVVDTTYLDYALKQKKLKDLPSTLQDLEAESRLGFKLSDALARAKVNNRKLLHGWHIFVTKDVAPGFDTYKEIIALNGGSAYLYQGRTGITVPKRRICDDPEAGEDRQHQDEEGEFDFVYLVSGVSGPEQKLWKTFRVMAEKQGMRARVVKNDWLLNAAMAQEVSWREEFELGEE